MRPHRALVLRVVPAVLTLLLLSFAGDVVLAEAQAQAQAPPPVAEDARFLPYMKSGRLVDVGGRHVNLICMGTGDPTVILMAGLFSWSVVWYKVQPVIAQKTRVCAFDRANYGFSDPSPRPQILSDVVDDLHAALQASSLPAPYVLVGHSLGGLEVRVYAQRWPDQVVGMVLVDSALAGQGLIDEEQPGFDEFDGNETYAADMLHCALLTNHGPLDPARPEYADCSSVAALPKDTPAAFKSIWPRFFTAAYFTDKVSLMSSVYTHRYDGADHHDLGALPLVVLTAEYSEGKRDTPAGEWFERSYAKVWTAKHEALARLSSRGVHRFVAGSGHQIEIERPQVVIDAVDEVLRAGAR